MPEKLKQHEVELIRLNGFAQLVVPQKNGTLPVITQTPLLLSEDKKSLLGHLSCGNRVFKDGDVSQQTIVVFDGGHQYISPRWHQEQVVPTWNYAQLQITCTLESMCDAQDKLDFVTTLSNYYDPDWQLGDLMSPAFDTPRTHMINAIEVFKLHIESISSRFKLSQNKSAECRGIFAEKMITEGLHQLAGWQMAPPVESRK